ncbi:TonB-dependent receptor plug domain-containing protein [Colwellia sp. RE-S-Sl-9]
MSYKKINRQEFKLTKVASSFLLLSLVSSGVYAQQAETSKEKKEESVEKITVTGSKIQRLGFETSTPVNVVAKQEIEESGFASIYDVLKSVPSIGVGLGSANGSAGGVSDPEAGASFINLRGLGTDRSLVLVDGRRRVSGSSASSAVDLSMIPAGLIERVEVITGGASAVYGADAVSGVVNMIMKDKIEGMEVSVSTGASTEGSGGERFALDLSGGAEFANGRGSIVVGVSYSKENELQATQRDFGELQLSLRPNPANTGPDDGIPDQIHLLDQAIYAFSPKGAFNIGGTWYTDDNGVRPIDRGVDFDSQRGIGAEGYRSIEFTPLRQDQETLASRFSVNYKIAEDTNFFLDADYGITNTVGAGQPDNTTSSGGFAINTLRRENPLLPDDLTALMDANGLTSFKYNRAYANWGYRAPILDRTSYSIVAGFNGYFANEWSWDISFQDASYENESKWANHTLPEYVEKAIDVIEDPITGEAVCRSGGDCVPIYPLSQDPLTAEQSAYIEHTVLRLHKNEQRVISASLSGDVFELPAGDVLFAAGVEHRNESIKTLDDGLAQRNQLHLFKGQEPQDAELNVDEAYVEFVVPVLSDIPAFEQLDIEAAVRFSDYDTIGSTTATKLGFNWTISEDVRIRASTATSVRAPNLSELYSPGVSASTFTTDACHITQIELGTATRKANCAALGIPVGWVDPDDVSAKLVVTGGNPNLSEEESDSVTIGAVLTPSFMDGFSLSVDYWDIEITGAIGTFSIAQIINNCVDSPTLDNQFCPLLTRGSNLSITNIDVTKINVGRLNARGVDFEGFYRTGIFEGNLSVSFNGSYLMEHEQLVDENDPTSLIVTRNEPNNPKFRANLNFTYSQDALSVGLKTRYIGSTNLDNTVLTDESIDTNDVNTRIYNDLIFGYKVNDDMKVQATVTNLLNVDPPRRAGVYLGSSGNYDNTGRFVSIRATYNF